MVTKHFICPPGGKITHYNVDLNSQSYNTAHMHTILCLCFVPFPEMIKKKNCGSKKKTDFNIMTNTWNQRVIGWNTGVAPQ